jgi:hypothetical protein
VAPIVEVSFEPLSNVKASLGINRHVPKIKEAMDVCSQENAVRGHVLAPCRVRFDMRRI